MRTNLCCKAMLNGGKLFARPQVTALIAFVGIEGRNLGEVESGFKRFARHVGNREGHIAILQILGKHHKAVCI